MSLVGIAPSDFAFCRGCSRKRRNPFEDQLSQLRSELVREFSGSLFPARRIFEPVIKKVCASPATDKCNSVRNMKVVKPDEKKNFCLQLKMDNFHPEEITVKVKERLLTIHATHEEKSENDGEYLCEEFHRELTLPSDVNPEQVSSRLTSDGLLQISAPRVDTIERIVRVCKGTSDAQEPNVKDGQTNGDDAEQKS